MWHIAHDTAAAAAVKHTCLPPLIAALVLQVVDRVLLQSGSQKWWAALIGRGKMQRAWNQHTAMNIVSCLTCLNLPEHDYCTCISACPTLLVMGLCHVALSNSSLCPTGTCVLCVVHHLLCV